MTPPADSLGRFVWHDLMTTNVDRARSFYTALFPEWAVATLPLDGGFDYHMLSAGEGEVGGMLLLDAAFGVPSHWLGYVAVAECDAAVNRVEQLGGTCVVPAMEMAAVGKMAVVRDPQGAHFKLFQMAFPRALPQRPAVGQFCWDELLTSDVAAARRFYSELFGWQAAEKQVAGLGAYTHFQQGGIDFAGAIMLPAGAEAPTNWLPYLSVDDCSARAAAAARLGATTYVEPRDIEGVGRFSVHADPTGAAFALLQRFS